jgi:type VI secretion system secreted protein Hcp
MAETTHIWFKFNGTDIKGSSTQMEDRADSIEAIEYHFEVNTAREAGSGMATGRRQYSPIRILKRCDVATPLILKALVDNQDVEMTAKFYRPKQDGTAGTEHFMTHHTTQGRISKIWKWSPNSANPGESRMPEMEWVEQVFGTFEVTWVEGGVGHKDEWQKSAMA